MTPRQTLATCLRLAALIWALYALSSIPRYFIHLVNPPVDNRAMVYTLVGVQVVACGLLWLFPATLAKALLSLKADVTAVPAQFAEWQVLGLVCVGLWGLIRAIPDVMYWAVILQTWMTADYGLVPLTVAQKARIVSTVFELALSLGLVFGARRIAGRLFAEAGGR